MATREETVGAEDFLDSLIGCTIGKARAENGDVFLELADHRVIVFTPYQNMIVMGQLATQKMVLQ